MTQLSSESLYSRLGGYDVIAAYLDNVLGLVVADPQLAPYFRGMSTDTARRTRQLILDWVVEKTGGPAIFTGRPLKVSHEEWASPKATTPSSWPWRERPSRTWASRGAPRRTSWPCWPRIRSRARSSNSGSPPHRGLDRPQSR